MAADTKLLGRAAVLASFAFLGSFALLPRITWAADAEAEAAAPGEGLQTVTVTATRRAESAQSVPVAVSAITADTARQIGITDAQSFANAVPGLNFNRQAAASIPFLRGVGSPVGEAGDEPSVALYVDDVYMPSGSASLSNFNSLERVEVAKGPQGTLFGRNAVGGVVQVFTRNPSAKPEFEINAGIGNYQTYAGNLYASGGTDKLSANIALYGSDQIQGWGRNTYTGQPTFTAWDGGGRIKVLWTPSDSTTLLLNGDFDVSRQGEGLGYQPRPGTGSLNPVPPFPNGGFPPSSWYNNIENWLSFSRVRQQGVSLKLTQDLGFAQLVNITAWRFTKTYYPLDEDAGPLPIVNVNISTPEQTWTQELRLQSTGNSKTTWIVGMYYFRDFAGFSPLHFTGLAFAPLEYADAFGMQRTKSWSGFGEITQEFLPDTRFTVGLRYTSDDRTIEAGYTPGIPGVPPTFVPAGSAPGSTPSQMSPQSATWDKLTWRFVLDHHFTKDFMGYIGANRGFKSGLFNPVVLPGAGIDPPVAPEVLDAYTLGQKAEFWDHRLRVNTEGFYYKYKNIQVDEVLSGVTHITNAAAATIKGVDLDVSVLPTQRLSITAALEGLWGTYDSFPNGTFFAYNPVTGGNCTFVQGNASGCLALPPNYNSATGTWDLKGNKTIQTPPFSASLMVAYTIPSTAGEWTPALAWKHFGNYFFDADNGKGQIYPSQPFNDKQPTVNLLNASLSWVSPDGHWNARLWGNNLIGVQYISFGLEDSFATQASPAAPRTFGLWVGYKM